MTTFYQLGTDRHRTWPWPKVQLDRAFDTAFGIDGTCPKCRRALRDEPPKMVLMSGGKTFKGVWVPNFWFDSWCVDLETFEGFSFAHEFETTPVEWRGGDGGAAVQLVIPIHPEPLFDPAELYRRTVDRHGRAGQECAVCGVWRWMPMGFKSVLPDPIVTIEGKAAPPALASQELFGDGGNTHRQIFFREDVAAALQAAQKGVRPTGVVIQ